LRRGIFYLGGVGVGGGLVGGEGSIMLGGFHIEELTERRACEN
jgi:hypothetical protein